MNELVHGGSIQKYNTHAQTLGGSKTHIHRTSQLHTAGHLCTNLYEPGLFLGPYLL
jgi:hypothetical protein